jgi:predicted Zn finger-like uncharacterized protein
MIIVCPHCNFTREVTDAQVPDRPVKVTCPKCRQGFNFDKNAAVAATVPDADFTETPGSATVIPEEKVVACPACGLAQPAGDACAGCGVIYTKWAARHEGRPQPGDSASSPRTEDEIPGRAAYLAAATSADQPKAGFWARFVAYLLDSLILGAVQFGIGLALGFAGGAMSGFDGEESLAMGMLTWLCGMVIGITYAVFFTGYNGQTPGKMALRIQVVRTDGTPMTYGRAFLREVIGKFASAIILGIGYLMVAFDRNKQGLHDKIAGTYVIRL